MIVIMKKEATEEQIKKVVDHIEKEGFKVSIDQGTERVVIGLKGDTRSLQEGAFTRYEGVENAVRILNTYKLTSREFHPGNTVVDVDGVKIGDGSFVTMAGPCSIEGLDQIRECARMAKAGGRKNSARWCLQTTYFSICFPRFRRRRIEIHPSSG